MPDSIVHRGRLGSDNEAPAPGRPLKALVIGGTGFIGSALVCALRERDIDVEYTTRQTLDLLKPIESLPSCDIVYICAAMSRFIECEDNPLAYRVNVDAPREIAELVHPAQVIYLSSEAVERALHTNYGLHKALAEVSLRTVCRPIIVRLSKVSEERLDDCLDFLVGLASIGIPGKIYHWPNRITNTYYEGLISARL